MIPHTRSAPPALVSDHELLTAKQKVTNLWTPLPMQRMVNRDVVTLGDLRNFPAGLARDFSKS